MMDMIPIYARQLILPRVRMLAIKNPATAATATKTQVQLPWSVRALRAMETLSIPEPAMKVKSKTESVQILR
jgi:hypothetical protein